MMRDVPLVTDFVWKTIPYHEETFQEGVKRDFLDVYIDEVRKTKDPNSPFHKSNSGNIYCFFTPIILCDGKLYYDIYLCRNELGLD